jgi:hypothetical protein
MRTFQIPAVSDSSSDGPAQQDVGDAVSTARSDERPAAQRRQHLRFDKIFAVRVESLLFGDLVCVARNVSAGGLFLELAEPLPLGSTIRVCFPVPDGSGEVVAVGEVKNHYFINYVQNGVSKAVAGMAVRFSSFESDSHRILEDCLSRLRVLH